MPISNTAPLGEIIKYMLPGAGGRLTPTGTLLGGIYTVRIPWTSGNTNTGNPNWINPESGTVLAKAYFVIIGSAGTGTFDMGRGSDGTGTSAVMISAGTLTAGVWQQVTTGSAAATSGTAGVVNQGQWLIGPGGTGTNNSIVCRVVDTTTSTMIPNAATGAVYLLVEYRKVE